MLVCVCVCFLFMVFLDFGKNKHSSHTSTFLIFQFFTGWWGGGGGEGLISFPGLSPTSQLLLKIPRLTPPISHHSVSPTPSALINEDCNTILNWTCLWAFYSLYIFILFPSRKLPPLWRFFPSLQKRQL
ncbi:hypothetical protein HJG60_010137 [Phyllostomus discolor]|uniref:Uncharacterized protein n=1 Tax=Phyllostomus discolor TaxID=89673 RepID=A0A834AXQ3_9CHIR|nr:hypothetical protein HJG60_010137 [Phyllostomus discolor]